ncbi:MAG: acetyl-CoA carboxylase biotin carboxyl carrier protein subunit [Candidatus Zhuqueibacterota bacterium]
MDLEFKIDQDEYQIIAQKKDARYQLKINGQPLDCSASLLAPHCLLIEDKQRRQRIYLAEGKDRTFVFINGRQLVLECMDASSRAAVRHGDDLHDGGSEIRAPMPGKVLKILVEVNQEVQPKQSLVIVEAMKMEHNITAPKKAVVTRIHFKEGDVVDAGQQLLELQVVAE